MSLSEYNTKPDDLGEPGISLTTMWFLLAIVISFTMGFVTFGYIEPKPAFLIQSTKAITHGPITTVSHCSEMLDEINKNKQAYAKLHLGEPTDDLHSYCVQSFCVR